MSWSPDAELRHADWTKQTWDLPTDVDALIRHLCPDEPENPVAVKLAVLRFMTLPASRAMPDDVKRHLRDRLGL